MVASYLVCALLCLCSSAEIESRSLQQQASIEVNLDDVLHNVSEQFLSVTLDAGNIRYNWTIIDFTDPRVLSMAKGLAPAMLRVGGTEQDFLLFGSSNSESYADPKRENSSGNFSMDGSQWDRVNAFAAQVGWDLIFGLNDLLRKPWPEGNWDFQNALTLIKYTMSKGYNVSWELANEPDHFPKVAPDIPVSPEQLSSDFQLLKEVLSEAKYSNKFLAGPDVASDLDYLTNFLKAQQTQGVVVGAATWHHYYANGNTAVLADFTDVKRLDSFSRETLAVMACVKDAKFAGPVWLGETSSTYDGGTKGLSDSYVAGFMWLDKLGLAALWGVKKVFRQEFIARYYGLLDLEQYPLPDYWLSLLYKRLVGTRVLSVKGSIFPGRYVRVYAHCASMSYYQYPRGSVVLLVLNLNPASVVVPLLNQELSDSRRDVYWLTPNPSSNITSHEVLLNGQPLTLIGDNLPDTHPLIQSPEDHITLPKLSFGFYVFWDTKANACL